MSTDIDVAAGWELLDAEELARRMKLSKAQIWRLTREGKLPSIKAGRYRRYDLRAVQEWAANGGAE